MLKSEKELIKKIKEQMPEFVGSKEEIEKNIAMYIYLMLGKEKVYDENFFLADEETKKKMIRLHEKRRYTLNNIIKDRKLTCIQMADLYAKVLGDFSIKSKVERVNPQCSHYFNVIKFSNGESIIADLQKDLPNIQTKSRTRHFGEKYQKGTDKFTGEKMPEDEIIKLQKNCNYIESDADYMDGKISALAQKLKGLSPDRILDEILNNKEVNKIQEDIGYIELYNYYSHLISKVAPEYDKRKIDYFNCYRKRNDENGKIQKDYTMCIYALNDDNDNDNVNIYLYSKSEKQFKKIDVENLKEIEKKGLVLGKSQSDNGVTKLREFMNNDLVRKFKAGDNNKQESREEI